MPLSLPPVALLQTVELSEQPAKPAVKSPTGFVLGTTQKAFLVVLVMGILYFRLRIHQRKKRKICSHCGKANPAQQTNCIDCSAPLFRE